MLKCGCLAFCLLSSFNEGEIKHYKSPFVVDVMTVIKSTFGILTLLILRGINNIEIYQFINTNILQSHCDKLCPYIESI